MNKKICFLLILTFCLVFSSCRSKKALIKAPLKEYGELYLLKKMMESETNFDYFSGKCSISLSTDPTRKLDVKAQIRIKKDSIIWISLSPAFGIEVARIVVTTDSVKFINRLEKTYFEDDFSFINTHFSSTIDFDVFQAVLTGNDLAWYDDDNFRASVDNPEYRLSSTKRGKRKRYLKQNDTTKFLVQSLWLHPESFKITRLKLKEFGDETKQLNATYSDFQKIDNQIFPSVIHFELRGAMKANVKINFTKIDLNQQLDFPFRIPDNFSEIR